MTDFKPKPTGISNLSHSGLTLTLSSSPNLCLCQKKVRSLENTLLRCLKSRFSKNECHLILTRDFILEH